MAFFHARLFRGGTEHGFVCGGVQGAAGEFVAVFVEGPCLEGAGVVGGLKLGAAGVFQTVAADLFTVEIKVDSGGTGVDFDIGFVSFTAFPGPAFDGVGHFPGGGGMFVSGVVDRAHGNHRAGSQFEGYFGVGGFGEWFAGEIDAATAGGDPAGTVVKFRGIIFVFPGANADFTEVIHTGPDEITDDTGIFFGHFPEGVGIVAEGFAAKDEAVRVFFQVVEVAFDTIVVAGNIHIGESTSGPDITAVEGSACFHKTTAHQAGKIVEKLAADGFLLLSFAFPGVFSFFFCFFITVNTKADGA